MKAIILAAGRGSRMHHMTDSKPKCLVELHGKSLLDRQIAALKLAGISEIGIVTGYKRELLIDRNLVEFHNPRWFETNMVFSLACAVSWLQSETCIVSYSDIFFSPEVITSLLNSNSPLSVTYDPDWLSLWKKRFVDPLVDAETFRLGPKNTLKEIGKKPNTIEEIEGQYMGLLLFKPQGWAEIQRVRATLTDKEFDKIHMTGILQKIIDSERISITAIGNSGVWGEVDTVDDLNVYENETDLKFRQLFNRTS